MAPKFKEILDIQYYLTCPLCKENYFLENFENHLLTSHNIDSLEIYGFELTKIIGVKYYFDFTINKIRNHNTRGFSIRKGLNDYIANLPNQEFLEKFQEDNELKILGEDKLIYISWDNIFFQNEYVTIIGFYDELENNLLKFPGSFEKLNEIKDSFFKKNHKQKFKYYIKNGHIDINQSEGYEQMTRILDTKKPKAELHKLLLNYDDFTIINTKHLNNNQILNLNYFTQYDNKYFKFLSSLHNSNEKLIPIIEFNNGKKEYSMVFQISTRNYKQLIVWENLNSNRATYVFRKLPDTLNKLKDYVSNTNIKNKRLRLFRDEDKLTKKELNFYRTINHNDFDSYKQRIETIIKIN